MARFRSIPLRRAAWLLPAAVLAAVAMAAPWQSFIRDGERTARAQPRLQRAVAQQTPRARAPVAASAATQARPAPSMSAPLPADAVEPRVFYLAASGDTRFHDAYALSDGTVLLAGETANLDWVPGGVPRVALGLDQIVSQASGRIGVIVQVSGDLSAIRAVAHFPAGSVRSVARIRGTEQAGAATGALYVSGHRDGVADAGYFIARLNNNFVQALPTALAWGRNIGTRSEADGSNAHKSLQPWDVGSDGKVVYVEGKAFDANWAAIHRLDANGNREVVPHWRNHWTQAGPEWRGTPAALSPQPLAYSGIVLKNGRVGQLRSADAGDYAALAVDENGNPGRKGRWPDDYYFAAHCAYAACSTATPGYTGYRPGATPTQRVGAVVIDRRDNAFYFGTSTQSRLPDGNPDFEPAVVAMNADGSLRWWARLYRESSQNSTPDQYVDGLALDPGRNRLVVLARAHGNNVVNFWPGNEITASPGASGFQNRFSGTNGNIHLSWLGSYAIDTGRIHHATWLGEFNEGVAGGAAHPDPLLGGWPNPNAGWPDLNTTRCRSRLAVYADGSVAVACTGRRTATTTNAWQRMPLPSSPQKGTWNDFVRVYTPDLSGLRYSSLLTGDWNRADGSGGGNTTIASVLPVQGALIAVGHHAKNATTGAAQGIAVPTTRIPAWGRATPTGETAIVGWLPFATGAQ